MIPWRWIALAGLNRHRFRDNCPRTGFPQGLEFVPRDTQRSRRIHEAAGKGDAGNRCRKIDHEVTSSVIRSVRAISCPSRMVHT